MELQKMNLNNLFFDNPVDPGNVREEYYYGKEKFYLIDFWNIKDNYYYISSYGRIFSVIAKKELNQQIGSCGYFRVKLRTNNGSKKFSIHRLVAMAFIPKSIEDLELGRDTVNHKDTIKQNNRFQNLEWCTHQENMQHCHDMKVRERISIMTYKGNIYDKEPRKIIAEQCYNTVINIELAHKICQLLEQGYNCSECCIKLGLEPNKNNTEIVRSILKKQSWQHVSCNYNIIYTNKLEHNRKMVHEICKLIAKGYSNTDIIEMLNLKENLYTTNLNTFLFNIRNKQYHKDIIKLYF